MTPELVTATLHPVTDFTGCKRAMAKDRKLTPEIAPGPPAIAERSLPPILRGRETPDTQVLVQQFYSGVAELFERWVARRASDETRRAYRGDVMRFVEWMRWEWPRDASRFLTVSVANVQDHRDWLDEHYAALSRNRALSSLSSWFKFLSAAAVELRLPINVPNPAHSQFIPRGRADPENPAPAVALGVVRQLLFLPEGADALALRDRAVLATFFYSGARVGAISTLQVVDFFEDENGATLRLHEKGDQTRTIGLHVVAATAIKMYIEAGGLEDGPLFRRSEAPRSRRLGSAGISDRNLRALMTKYFRQVQGGERFTPHSARATVATELLAAGEDPVKVQQLLGHASLNTTLKYDRRRQETREGASHKLVY